MKTTKTALAAVKANPNNPRTISPDNERLLVRSILEFPKMLEIRPVVTDSEGMILGGNMRYKALTKIAAMTEEEIVAEIASLRSSQSKTAEEVENLTTFWCEWLREPFTHVIDASTLSEAEKQAFIIKDNVNFGHWEFDMLDNFNQEDLQDWGVNTWGGLTPLTAPGNTPEPIAHADNRERIILIFPRERKAEVEQLLRLPGSKNVYRLDELINGEGQCAE